MVSRGRAAKRDPCGKSCRPAATPGAERHGRALASRVLSAAMIRILRALVRSGPAGLGFVAVTLGAAAALYGFFDLRALVVTLGGTLAVTVVTFPPSRLRQTWTLVAEALAPAVSNDDVLAAVQRLARVHRTDGPPALERAVGHEPDAFLRAAVLHGLDCETSEELEAVLVAEARVRAADGEAARHVLATLAKLFPAFGLIGTLVGLSLLLRRLDTADVAAIGPGLAVAVLTTFYGAVLSNVVVFPLATRLQAHLARQAARTEMIIDGTLLVHRREYPSRIEHALRPYVGLATRDERSRRGLVLTTRAA
jgi:chemotaxis protein MotA